MAKFNLSSVYTNDNIYSVLKLLKALIDTLDNYEFQDPIVDANGNQIPMTWFQKLYKSINGTDDGSVAVSKDATINGSLKLGTNSMFAYISYPDGSGAVPAIMQYRIDNGNIIVDTAIAFDTASSMLLSWFDLSNATYANGVYTTTNTPNMVDLTSINVDTIGTLYGDVSTLKRQVSNILPHVSATATRSADNANSYNISFNANNIPEPFILDVTGDATFSAIIVNNLGSCIYDFDGEQASLYWASINNKTSGFVYRISLEDWLSLDEILSTYQSKLYRHTLNVKGASYFAVFDYYCPSSEPITSTQDLTTYLKPTATSVYPCTCFTNNAAPTPANMNAIKYSSNVWKFCFTGRTTETLGDSVLSVSDSVTAVD